MKKSDNPHYASDGKRMIRVSYTPNTWIEVDENATEAEIKNKIKIFKQLTGTK